MIAPLGDKGSSERKRSDQVLKHIISPAAKKCGYDTIRADQIAKPGMIGPQIVQHLIHDPLVIADLTGQNPNVFYELAIRHISAKPVIQIIQTGETLPFDIAQLRTISFNYPDLDDTERCRDELVSYIRAAEVDPTNFRLMFESVLSPVPDAERQGNQTRARRKPPEDEIQSYIASLQSGDTQTRVYALQQLSGLTTTTVIETHKELVPNMKRLLKNSNKDVRRAALQLYERLAWHLKSTLKKTYSLQINPIALKLASRGDDLESERSALGGLVAMEDEGAIDVMIKILRDKELEPTEIIQDHIWTRLVDRGLGPKLRLQLFKTFRDTNDPVIRERISKFTRHKYLG